jgi:hypothetical protein
MNLLVPPVHRATPPFEQHRIPSLPCISLHRVVDLLPAGRSNRHVNWTQIDAECDEHDFDASSGQIRHVGTLPVNQRATICYNMPVVIFQRP